MEIFFTFDRLSQTYFNTYCSILSKQCYWLIVFLLACWMEDVEKLMLIVYDDKHLLPKHAHALAGKAALRIMRRYAARQYQNYRILRDVSARFRRALYDIWLLLPELRTDVDCVRKEFVTPRHSRHI